MRLKSETIICILLFVLAFSVRWYRLPETLFFGFEQGRDAVISRSISQFQDFVLVGPKTDIDGVFHGAWYYYLMAIPYTLSGGNPLGATLFIVTLSSFVPLIMLKLVTSMTKRLCWGTVAGVLTALSYEYICYSRWLSNVTPAVLIVALVYGCLWLYRQTTHQKWLVGAMVLAGLASQFQIILGLLFVIVFMCLWLMRWMPRPTLKSLVISGVCIAVLFAPMVLFNLRNEWVTVKALTEYSTGDEGKVAFHPQTALPGYGEKMTRLIRNTFVPVKDWHQHVLVVSMIGAGLWMVGDKSRRPAVQLCLVWSLMTLPLLLFPRSLALTQLYVGSGLGLIGLVTLTLARLWPTRLGKVLVLGWFVLFTSGLATVEYNLLSNQDILFKTVQDDLNYQDQRALLQYVNQDAAGQPYRLVAFTIPYFQPEAWQYLHQYWYPQATDQGAQTIYVVIEEKVDPYWEKQWIEDLGLTKEVETKKFGLLRVQKRRIL
jgi:hypothetical protein